MAGDEELIALYERVSNAGRWGRDDELGTLNHITAEKRRGAGALIRTGEVVSLAHPISPDEIAPEGRVELEMQYGRPPEAMGVPWSVGDRLTIEAHASAITHVDCVGHIADLEHRLYNGRPFDEVAQEGGLAYGSVFAQRGGIVSRGILLDLPAALGLPWIGADREISARDLERAETHAGVRVSTGDILVIRVGREPRLAQEREETPGSPGLGADGILWLHQREIAAYGGDAPDRVTPRGARLLAGKLTEEDRKAHSRFIFPLHQVAIPGMGLVLFDHLAVEELALVCARLGRHEFMFVAAPLPVRGGSGSAVNPLALF